MKYRKYLIEGGILTIVFIAAVLIFSYATNKENHNMTADMEAATRPQLTFSYNGYALNTLPAYVKEMDITAVRDTVTPVTNGNLQINLKHYDNNISALSYAVYTLDGEEMLLEQDVKEPGEEISLSLIGDGLLSTERILKITLVLDGEQEMYFYTRIVDAAGLNASECLDYIRDFHENILDKAENAGISLALESDEQGDNTTFQHVTIHSDYDHVTWGDLEPEVEGSEQWDIKEINSTSTSVQLQYRVRCKGEENETDVYNVTEFFRVRHISNGGNNYLLDYVRTMEQVFEPSHVILNEKGILLGITESDVPYIVNEDGTSVSFVQANEVWNYNKSTDEISLVFSFADAENTDVRNLFSQHEIRLLDMDGEGNTVFAVCGYMNRGEHEGETGISVYYYNIGQNSVEEKVFISSDKCYGRVMQELGKLLYYNVEKNMLYVMAGGTLYEVNVEKGKTEELASGIEENSYVVSGDGHAAAYPDDGGTGIIVQDFSGGTERAVENSEGESLTPLGFIKNDFVYGVARTEDIGKSVSGQEVVPMYKIEIEDSKGEAVKTYEQNGFYIIGTEVEDNMITLSRATKNGSTYIDAGEDYITNNEEKEESNIYAEAYVTELKETQVRLAYADGISDKEPKLLKPKQVLHEKAEVVTFNSDKGSGKKYYVYGYGKLQGIYDNAGKAVREADSYNGVVVGENQAYIWERGNRDLEYTISDSQTEIETLRTKLKEGQSAVEIMEEMSGGQSMDLSGCAVEQLLYIINQDKPVIAMLDAGTAVILVGYTDETVIYEDVENGETHSVSYEEIDNMTKGSGNTYVGTG